MIWRLWPLILHLKVDDWNGKFVSNDLVAKSLKQTKTKTKTKQKTKQKTNKTKNKY